MSAQNGQRARFHRNRKRRVLQRMRSRAAHVMLKEQAKAAGSIDGLSPSRSSAGGPALQAR